LRRGRDEMDARVAWVARDSAELRRAVEAWLAGEEAATAPEAAAWVAGGTLPRPAAGTGRLLALPGYAFARERHWLPEVAAPVAAVAAEPVEEGLRAAVLSARTEMVAEETRLPGERLGADCAFEE